MSKSFTDKVHKIKSLPQKEIDSFVSNDKDFLFIIDNAKKTLEKELFVVIKNIGFNKEKGIFESFVKQFGEFYGAVEYTGINFENLYTGSKHNRIYYHNDDAIDVNTQPRFGFIQVAKEDPLKITHNYIVRIDEMVNYLELYDNNLLTCLFNTKVNMLSYGVNFENKNKEEIILNEPILYVGKDNHIRSRFDVHRINHFYWKKEIEQPLHERKLISDFLLLCEKFSKKYYLEQGDIFIHNNQRTLHDRDDCSIEIDENGKFITREIMVSFAR